MSLFITPIFVLVCVCAENYHQLFDILSRMKISCLERWREEAKRKFRTHKKQYVDKSLGRPMEKLSVSSDYIISRVTMS